MGRQNHPCTAVHPGQFFHCNGVAQHVQPGAAVLLRIRNPHEPQLCHLRYGFMGELISLIQLEGNGFDFLFRKCSDFLPERFVRLSRFEQHMSPPDFQSVPVYSAGGRYIIF